MRLVVLLSGLTLWCSACIAQSTSRDGSSTSTNPANPPPNTRDQPNAGSFFGPGWGIGIALVKNKTPMISDATLVNGTVRANNEQRWLTELLLTRHWYFGDGNKCDNMWPKELGCLGLFVGVGITGGGQGSQLIDMVAGGLMVGFGPVTQEVQNPAHNLGIGIGRRFNVKTLG